MMRRLRGGGEGIRLDGEESGVMVVDMEKGYGRGGG